MSRSLPEGALRSLEDDVREALARGGQPAAQVLGYGEISAVLRCEGHACKRLPPFPDQASVHAYAHTFAAYLDALATAGVRVIPSTLEVIESPAGLVGWVVQPLQPAERLVPRWLADHPEDAPAVLDAVCARVHAACSPRLGVDAQASNWLWLDEGLAYLDVTTPLMRDAQGREALDTDLFLASLPWALRGLVRRLLLSSILDKYYEPRGALLDFLGNLVKEGLTDQVPALVAQTVQDPALTMDEILAYYREDARMWALLQRLRRVDRWWQRAVRRRPYPFLLPGGIERHV